MESHAARAFSQRPAKRFAAKANASSAPSYVESLSAVSPITADARWHTITAPSNARKVELSVYWVGSSPADYVEIATRKYGSVAAYNNVITGIGRAGGLISQPCDAAGRWQYNAIALSGTIYVKMICYFV